MKKNQAGFTLIEIAIVLVIIGLLLGAVLRGQEMINSARVRALDNSLSGSAAAWFAFQDRYRALPGDYNLAVANLPAAGGVNPVNGTGNGQVDTVAEVGQLWLHLQSAGLITGAYTGTAATAGAEYDCPVGRCPNNQFGMGIQIMFSNVTFGGATSAHTMFSGSQITVGIAAELDRKIDDGAPGTGIVRGGSSNGAAAACVTGGANPTYDVTNANPSPDCGVAVRNL